MAKWTASPRRESWRSRIDILIREETAADLDTVRRINRLAFGQDEEAELVDRLRADGDVVLSLVAVEEGQVVGHILFSALPIERKERVVRGAALAPMAVRPDRQREGIGTALVRAGLEACKQRELEAVVVLGHETYYPRFGFSAETARTLRAPFAGNSFMALELVPGVLNAAEGTVRYAPAFGIQLVE